MSAYAKIDEVEQSPKFVNCGPVGWGFTLWSHLLDDEAPHRPVLEQFARVHEGFSLTLPKPDRYEDCVEGSLKWETHDVWVYFETILSHLWLWSPDRQAVEELRALIVPVASKM